MTRMHHLSLHFLETQRIKNTRFIISNKFPKIITNTQRKPFPVINIVWGRGNINSSAQSRFIRPGITRNHARATMGRGERAARSNLFRVLVKGILGLSPSPHPGKIRGIGRLFGAETIAAAHFCGWLVCHRTRLTVLCIFALSAARARRSSFIFVRRMAAGNAGIGYLYLRAIPTLCSLAIRKRRAYIVGPGMGIFGRKVSSRVRVVMRGEESKSCGL